ncbi:cornifelin homolog A-like [Erpetoichthys calabaricus]|uniref:Cornifelin homolog A-like n=1 Tax=Erpetoichthys calabaricus TaxID=27687 RepID=A0A8C4TC73_ERPCA|nr:cornifelin homolog A-like [Erpetoichthys calabaricus]
MAHPVTVQPAPMIPTAFSIPRPGTWSTELCDCCSDVGICVCGTFIPCILACKVAQDYGECCCLPCLPGTILAIRTGLRERRKIPGNVCGDWLIMTCCSCCALCQLARELKVQYSV